MAHSLNETHLNSGSIYEGKSLVDRLLQYCAKFENTRERAIKYAQKLLDLGHIEGINGSKIFQDGAEKYRWTDVASVLNSKMRRSEGMTSRTNNDSHILKTEKPKRTVRISIETDDCEDTEIRAHIRSKPYKADQVTGTVTYETRQGTNGQIFEGKSMKKMLSFTSETSKTEEIMRIVPITPGVTQILEDEPVNSSGEVKRTDAIESIGKKEFQSRILKFKSATHPTIVTFETAGTADNFKNENKDHLKVDNMPRVEDKLDQAQSLEHNTHPNRKEDDNKPSDDRRHSENTNGYKNEFISNQSHVTDTNHNINEGKSLPFDLKSDIHNSPNSPRKIKQVQNCNTNGNFSENEDTSIKITQLSPQLPKSREIDTTPTAIKPLFWNKIQFPNNPTKDDSIWNNIRRKISFDAEEFSKLFSKPQLSPRTRKSRHDYTEGNVEGGILKVLSAERSRQVAIRSSTVHLAIEDIYDAIINLDDDLMDLDAIQALYEIRPSQAELDKIEAAIKRHPEAILDKPEQLLLMLAMISNLNERLQSWLFLRQFEDRATELEDHLIAVSEACRQALKNFALKHTLEIILTLGNFMNDGTNRGNAFGFHFDILPKIKDVKSKNGNINLLKYVVRKFIEEDETLLFSSQNEGAVDELNCPLPSQLLLRKAAAISMEETRQHLNDLSNEASRVEIKYFPKIIKGKTCNSDVETFSKKMAEQMRNIFNELDILNQFYETAIKSMDEFQHFFVPRTTDDSEMVAFNVTIEHLEQFCNDFRTMWTLEMREKAKEKILDMEKTKAERESSLNISDSPTALKKRFLEKRQRDYQHAAKALPMYIKKENSLTDDSRQSSALSFQSSGIIKEEFRYQDCKNLHAVDSQVDLYVGKARKNSLEIEERIRCMKFNNTMKMKMKMARNEQRRLLKAKTY